MDGPGNTTVFAYDASGKLVAEYSTNIAAAQDAKVSYLTNDHLNTKITVWTTRPKPEKQ